jgi:hypothetical protein
MRCLAFVGLLLGAVAACAGNGAAGTWEFEFETGLVSPGYNDVKIPGDTGTRLSFVDDLETDSRYFLRFKLTRRFNARHSLGLLVAPLSLEANGSVGIPVLFEGAEFPADADLGATYRFDSYRLTYGYSLYPSSDLTATVGITAKIRDAAIKLESDDLASEKTNTGFVPLLHFRFLWAPGRSVSVLLEADALAAPQGRAEDVIFALQYAVSPEIALRFGYRLLEGGADNDEVYNFTLVNYAVIGTVVRF